MPINLNTEADFSWNFGQEFFLKTDRGNYIWSDPDYNGDNTIRKYDGSHEDWCKETGYYARSKGRHFIGDYCGSNVIFI